MSDDLEPRSDDAGDEEEDGEEDVGDFVVPDNKEQKREIDAALLELREGIRKDMSERANRPTHTDIACDSEDGESLGSESDRSDESDDTELEEHVHAAAAADGSLSLGTAPSPPGSRDSEPIGDGGCAAHALSKLGVFPSVAVASARLNGKIAPVAATLRADQRVPAFVGVANDRWHPEVVKRAVIAEGFHFRKLPLASVNLCEELKRGRYLIDGVLNDSFVKVERQRGKRRAVRYDTDPDDPTTPNDNPAGWRHAIAVCDGRVLDREVDMPADWLWLKRSTPDPSKGYMHSVLKVYRISACMGGAGCKGGCSA